MCINATVDEDGVNWVTIGTIVRPNGSNGSAFDTKLTLSAIWPRKCTECHLLTRTITQVTYTHTHTHTHTLTHMHVLVIIHF